MNRPLSHRRLLAFGGVPAMIGASWGRVRTGILAAVLPALALASAIARAGDDSEFWPELNAFVKLNPQVRLHFAAAYTRGEDSYNQALDAAGYVDLSLKPRFRRTLRPASDCLGSTPGDRPA